MCSPFLAKLITMNTDREDAIMAERRIMLRYNEEFERRPNQDMTFDDWAANKKSWFETDQVDLHDRKDKLNMKDSSSLEVKKLKREILVFNDESNALDRLIAERKAN